MANSMYIQKGMLFMDQMAKAFIRQRIKGGDTALVELAAPVPSFVQHDKDMIVLYFDVLRKHLNGAVHAALWEVTDRHAQRMNGK